MIREWYSTYNHPEKPETIERDSRGILIEEGLRVAYNQSGNVVIGVITTLKKNEWESTNSGWRLKFEIHIKNEEGGTSKVKNPNSFVII